MTEADDAISIEDFEFDAANLEHMARHGLDPNIVWDVWGDTPILIERIGRSGTHLMIGETSSKSLWTVAVLLVDPELNVWADYRMAEHAEGGQNMARRKLTPEEESDLAAEAERLRDDDAAWDYAHPKRVRRGSSPSAVLSVRVPLTQLQALRKIAAAEGVALSDLLKEALASYAALGGPEVSSNRLIHLRVNAARPTAAETVQPGVRQLREADPTFVRPDIDKTNAS